MPAYKMAARLQRHDLHKLHGLGNDFLVWFQPELPNNAAERARQWCSRTTGIGADGLVVAVDDRVAPRFTLFNSDGGRAEVSGNGLRCFGHALAARRGQQDMSVIVETDSGDRAVIVTDALELQAQASVGMGAPAPGPTLDGLDLDSVLEYDRIDSIDLGNPHLVITVDSVDDLDIATIGPALESYFLPTGINVHLVTPTADRLRMKTWERGVGVTQACGSGACAVSAVAAMSDPGRESFQIEMPGGEASVEVGDELTLKGPSTYVGACEMPIDG